MNSKSKLGTYTMSAIGQDSHRFDMLPPIIDSDNSLRPLLLGGVEFPGEPPLQGRSDADVVLHALCNAISGITGINIIGDYAERMRRNSNITDSELYVKEAMKYLGETKIIHVSFAIECSHPIITPLINNIRTNISRIIGIQADSVCITTTSGENLTDFGRGLGIQTLCMITVMK